MAAVNDPSGLAELAAAIDAAGEAFVQVWRDTETLTRAGSVVPATQLRALQIVRRRGAVNVTGLAAELAITAPSASKLCDRLEAAGLLARDNGPSRREITLRLSPDGRELLDRMTQDRRDRLLNALAAVPPQARQALLTGLQNFSDSTSRHDDIDTAHSA